MLQRLRPLLRVDIAVAWLRARRAYASVVAERVFVTVPGLNGDSVFQAKASLELDHAGRIIGLEIN